MASYVIVNKDVNVDVDESYKISNALWSEIESLLPPEKPKPKGGHPRMDNREAMDAIFYLLRTGKLFHAVWLHQARRMIAFRSGSPWME